MAPKNTYPQAPPVGPKVRLDRDQARWRRLLADGSEGGRVRLVVANGNHPDTSLVVLRAG